MEHSRFATSLLLLGHEETHRVLCRRCSIYEDFQMTQQSYQRSVNILKTLTESTSNNLIEVYRPGYVNRVDRVQSLRYYGLLTALTLKIDINSMPETQIPDLDVTSSKVERMTAIRDMEWKSPRKQIDFYMRTSTSPLTHIVSISLLNRLPYYQVNLLQYLSNNGLLEIGNDCIIYARITDVGYGLLRSSDSVVIWGSAKEEITVLPDEQAEVTTAGNFTWIVEEDQQLIMPSNPNRLQATFVNNSNTTIFISYTPTGNVNSGIALLPSGGTYEINLSNPYRGNVYAKALSGSGQLIGMEAV
jgi:hypothetical protein